MNSDFKQRFSLDFLTTKPNTPVVNAPPLLKGSQDAVITYSGKVLAALSRSSNQKMQLFDLAKQLSERVDTLLPVMSFLTASGYLTRQEDTTGNDEFQLTDSGKGVAEKAQQI
jgi:hypothetical protein